MFFALVEEKREMFQSKILAPVESAVGGPFTVFESLKDVI